MRKAPIELHDEAKDIREGEGWAATLDVKRQESVVRENRMLRLIVIMDRTADQRESPPDPTVGAPVLDPTCVQQRLARSAGDRPAGVRARAL